MQAGEGVKRTKRRPRWGWLPVFERRLGPQHAVLIAGSGRSGTTWLAQVVNHDHSYRYYHEPFGPAVSPALRPVPICAAAIATSVTSFRSSACCTDSAFGTGYVRMSTTGRCSRTIAWCLASV